jgi:hypothetical protein
VDSSGTRTWELHDALGSVRQTLDDAGNPIYASGYGYSPFGVPASGAAAARSRSASRASCTTTTLCTCGRGGMILLAAPLHL